MPIETVHTEHMVDDLTPYELWQMKHYGSIVNSSGELLSYENWQQKETETEAGAIDAYWERQMDDHWGY